MLGVAGRWKIAMVYHRLLPDGLTRRLMNQYATLLCLRTKLDFTVQTHLEIFMGDFVLVFQ